MSQIRWNKGNLKYHRSMVCPKSFSRHHRDDECFKRAFEDLRLFNFYASNHGLDVTRKIKRPVRCKSLHSCVKKMSKCSVPRTPCLRQERRFVTTTGGLQHGWMRVILRHGPRYRNRSTIYLFRCWWSPCTSALRQPSLS
jgi:hypothetical protein